MLSSHIFIPFYCASTLFLLIKNSTRKSFHSNCNKSIVQIIALKNHWKTRSYLRKLVFQPLKFTQAVANCQGFCRGKQRFNSNHLSKDIAKVIISQQNIHSVNTYFSTRLLLTIKRYNTVQMGTTHLEDQKTEMRRKKD